MGNSNDRPLTLNVTLPDNQHISEYVSPQTTNKDVYSRMREIFGDNVLIVENATRTLIPENNEKLNPATTDITVALSGIPVDTSVSRSELPSAATWLSSPLVSVSVNFRLLNNTVVGHGKFDLPAEGFSGRMLHERVQEVATSMMNATVLHIGYGISSRNLIVYVEESAEQILPVDPTNYIHVVVQKLDNAPMGGRKRRR